MLNGHAAPTGARWNRVIARAVLQYGLVVTSTKDGVHAPASFHYSGRAVDFGLRANEVGTVKGRAKLVKFQKRMAKYPHWFAEVFGPDNASNVKNGQRISLAEGTALETAHDNHVHLAI